MRVSVRNEVWHEGWHKLLHDLAVAPCPTVMAVTLIGQGLPGWSCILAVGPSGYDGGSLRSRGVWVDLAISDLSGAWLGASGGSCPLQLLWSGRIAAERASLFFFLFFYFFLDQEFCWKVPTNLRTELTDEKPQGKQTPASEQQKGIRGKNLL